MKCQSSFHGLGLKQVRKLAYQYAIKVKKELPQNWKEYEMAGQDWMCSFLSRNTKLSLRTSESTSRVEPMDSIEQQWERFLIS